MAKTKNKSFRAGGASTINGYIEKLGSERAEIALCLKKEIEALLPKSSSKLYHGIPVWFVGENAIVGFGLTAKGAIKLLFWNGQAFKEPGLTAVGSFFAAQVEFRDASEMRATDLRRWIRKSGKLIWDSAAMIRARRSRS